MECGVLDECWGEPNYHSTRPLDAPHTPSQWSSSRWRSVRLCRAAGKCRGAAARRRETDDTTRSRCPCCDARLRAHPRERIAERAFAGTRFKPLPWVVDRPSHGTLSADGQWDRDGAALRKESYLRGRQCRAPGMAQWCKDGDE